MHKEELTMKRMKKLACCFAAAAMLAGCSSSSTTTTDSETTTTTGETYKIGLAQLVDHSSLNTIREAILDELNDEGYVDGQNVTIDYQNGVGQVANLDTIMSGYSSDGVDVIVAIATPTAQAAQKYSSSIPVVFSAVSDPVGAGLVESLEEPGGNITGTSDEVQIDQIIDLMMKVNPDAKTVGVLYNAGEANSVSNVTRFKEYAAEKGLTVVEKTGTDLTTMQQAATDLAESCDVMFSPNDNTVASAMVTLGAIAANAGVPYYVGADSMVETGGFATVGIDYEELGRETARMTIEVLNGTSPADIPVKVYNTDLAVYINKDLLDQFESSAKTKTELPDSVKDDYNVIEVTPSDEE